MERSDAEFIADLQREDDVGLVLRAHLHIENQLLVLIALHLPAADRCDWSKVGYAAKVEIASACGLPEDLKTLLQKIGKLRNELAHKIDAQLSSAQVLGMYNTLSTRLREGIKGSYLSMQRGPMPSPSSFDEPRDLFVLILLAARQATKAAALVAAEKR